jgi:hypothetical protein
MARRTNFLRFVAGGDGDDHRQLTGVLTEARFLRDAGALSFAEHDLLTQSYDWFNDHLPVPPFSRSRWRRDVVCWFKGDATASISRMWDVVAILRAHGVPTRLLRSDHPGKVVYEDCFQVVVDEFRSL